MSGGGRLRARAEVAFAAVVSVVFAATEAAAQGCAMCRTALGSPDDPLARGFYWSVLLLVAAPYAVAGSVGGWLAYRHLTAWRRVGDGERGDEAPLVE